MGTTARLILCGIATGALASGCASSSPSRATVRNWVQDVALGPEYGGDGAVCSRWASPPTLSVFGANAEQTRYIEDVVAQLNDVLSFTPFGPVTLVEANDAQADLLVYVTPLAEFPNVAERHGFRYVEGNFGYFWMFWNDRHEIYDAYVLLASDKLAEDRFRHFALEEITQSLGLANDSAAFPGSVFFANARGGGDVVVLDELDRRLIAFFYTYVQPGDRREALVAAFDAHWP